MIWGCSFLLVVLTRRLHGCAAGGTFSIVGGSCWIFYDKRRLKVHANVVFFVNNSCFWRQTFFIFAPQASTLSQVMQRGKVEFWMKLYIFLYFFVIKFQKVFCLVLMKLRKEILYVLCQSVDDFFLRDFFERERLNHSVLAVSETGKHCWV